jgi:hypothetical protein
MAMLSVPSLRKYLGQRAGGSFADLLEAERLLVEFRRGLGVVGRNRDVTQLGHGGHPVWLDD